MPTHKQAPELTQTDLARYSGRDPETVRKALAREPRIEPVRKDRRSLWYSAPVALERILCGTDGLDLTAERARLSKEQADGQALKNAELRGELVPGTDQDAALIALSTVTQARCLAVPAKVASECAAETSPHGCQAIVERELHAALHDLAEAGRRAAENEEERRARARRDATAAETQRPRVGRAAEGAAAGLA